MICLYIILPMQFHESKGVKFHMQSKVSKIVASEANPFKASAVIVEYSSGEQKTLPADVVIMGVGVAPATEYLRASKGFENALDRSGAVYVDELLRVKGVDSVYAIGKQDLCIGNLMKLTTTSYNVQVISRCIHNLALAS